MCKNKAEEELKKEFDKSFAKLFPDYVEGQNYDFSDGSVSKADLERYEEIGKVIEESLADTEIIEISLKTYGF